MHYLLFLKKRQNLKLPSAANYRWRFKVNCTEQWAFYYKSRTYMSAHVLLNLDLLNELMIKCEACRAFYLFFATNLINSIIQEHEC